MKKFYIFFALLAAAPITNTLAQFNLTVQLLSPTTGCIGAAETISISVINTQSMPYAGTMYLSYAINNGPVVSTSVTAFIPASGNYNYTFAVTENFSHCQVHSVMTAVHDNNDINFSDDTVFTEIENKCRPEFTAVVSVPVLTSGDGKLYCSVEGGQSPYFYVWTNLASFDSFSGQTWNGVGLGNYQIVVTDANDCIIDSTVQVVMGYLGGDQVAITKPRIYFTTDKLVIQSANFEIRNVIIYDSVGKLISADQLSDAQSEINLTLSPGIYFYQIIGIQDEVIAGGKFIAV